MDPHSEYLSSREAADRLGVKLPTLYAYTSRGLVRSLPGERGPARRYLRADIERLRARGESRRGGPPAGGGALRFGEPVLDSSITWLSDQGPMYRGHLAVDLAARDLPFESAAELLFCGELPEAVPNWQTSDLGVPLEALRELVPAGTPVLSILPIVVAALGARDPDRFDVRPEAVLPRARRTIRRCAAALALASEPERLDDALAAPTVAESLALALGAPPRPRRLRALDRALVLLADHELNASTFAARVAASARADLYGCLGAGLATVAGPRHGGASARVWALVREIGRPERATEVLRERLRRGELVPGFGHVVYRGRDPRTDPLLATARELAPRSRAVLTVEAVIAAMQGAGRPEPNVDVAIVAASAAIGLPPAATPALFAIARMAGWTAHALEQYELGFIVRPRARYMDPL